RAVRDVLVALARIAATKQSNDVARFHAAHGVGERHIECNAGGHGLEIATVRLAAQRLEVQSRFREEHSGRAVGNPATEAQWRRERAVAWQHALVARPRADYGVPGIAG